MLFCKDITFRVAWRQGISVQVQGGVDTRDKVRLPHYPTCGTYFRAGLLSSAHVALGVSRKMLLPKPNEATPQITLQGDAIDKKNKLSRHIAEGENKHIYCDIYSDVRRWEPTKEDAVEFVHPLVTRYFSSINSLVLKVGNPSERGFQKIPYAAKYRAYSIKLKEDEHTMYYHPKTLSFRLGIGL